MRNILRTFQRNFCTVKSETKVFFESVTSTVKGYLNPNYIK
jgi:hypothetical protein